MSVLRRRAGLYLLLFSVLIVTTGLAQEKEQKGSGGRTIYLEKGDEIPTDFTRRVSVEQMTDPMKKFVKKLPKNHKARVHVGKFYNQNSGNYNDRIDRMVMLGPDGKKDGVEWVYGGAGERVGLKRKVPWKNGKRHGKEKVFSRGPDGRYVQKVIPWKNGNIHGTKKVHHPSGKLMARVPYRNGKQYGKSKSFNDSGKLTQVVPYKNGKRHGRMVYYWSGTDQKKKVVPCKNGKVHGTARLFYKDGTKKAVMPFRKDVLHGVVKRYNENGELDRKRYWIDGEQVPKGVFDEKFGEK